MKEWKPDFVVDVGDFACQAGSGQTTPALHDSQLEGLRRSWALLCESPCPAYIAMGNHCVGWIKGGDERITPKDLCTHSHGGEDITKDEFLAVTKMPHRYYSFDVKGYHFIVLDPNNSGSVVLKDAGLSPEEIKGVLGHDGALGHYCIELNDDAHGAQSFSLSKGLLLCFIAGVLSAVYGIAINDTGKPIAAVAAQYGAGHWQTNVVYVFANSGAFLTTAVYTIWLGVRDRTFHEFTSLPEAPALALPVNYLLALMTGCLWYSQFLFYGLAHVRMGQLKFSSWAIHMTMLILISSLAGVAMREWNDCRLRTKIAIVTALTVLITAVLMLTYGNWVAEHSLPH